ncbi:MAG TPA: GNAT family N-acetyltransferase [Acetobacteraceae bacterium]|nr:GNAT family N-acetyltransferase [Acetobacteraceae bacterium]
MTISTERLRLRPWRDEDLAPFAALNADPRVMEHFPKTLDRAESDAFAARLRTELAERGFGRWAVEVPGHAGFIGYVGLREWTFPAPFTPCVEIGWRLAFEHWGKGFASEAAGAVLAQAFGPLGLSEVVSFTVPANRHSRAVMERLGMRRSPDDDFEHPGLPEGHKLRPHVLYRLSRTGWAGAPAQHPHAVRSSTGAGT